MTAFPCLTFKLDGVLDMEIGSKLKEAREARNLSLGDVQQETKIQTRYLQAIEEGNFSIMPGKFYTRAFIRQYAEAVGLDPEELMEEYKNELPSSSEEEYVQYTRLQKHKDEASNKSSAFFTFLPKIIIFILIVGIIAVAYVFYQSTIDTKTSSDPTQEEDGGDEVFRPGEDNSEENPTGSDNDQTNQEEDTEEEPPEEEEEQTPPEPKQELELVEKGTGASPQSTFNLMNVEEVKVKFELAADNGRSYLQVQNGKSKSFFDGEINANNAPLEYDMTGEEQLYFNIGRASDINLFINGEEFEFPVDPKAKVHQKIYINVKQPVE